MANGGGAAYQRLTQPKDGISQGLQYWGGILARENAAEKLAEERETVRKKAEDKAIREKYAIDPTKYNTENAGYGDLNEANTHFAREVINMNTKLQKQARDLALAGDYEGAEKIHDQVKINESIFKNDQNTMASHKANYEYMLENSDKMSGYAKGFENFYKASSGMGKVLKTLNDKGEIVHITFIKGEDGKMKRQIVNARDVQNGNYRAYLRQDLSGDVKKISENLGEVTRKTIDGYTSNEVTQWDDGKEDGMHTKAATEAIMAKLGSVEYMSDMVDQFDLYDEFDIDRENPEVGREFSDKEKKVVKDKILAQVRASYNETFKEDFESGKYSTDAASSRARKGDDDEEGQAEIMTDVKGGIQFSKPIEGQEVTGIEGTQFSLKTKGGKTIKGISEVDKDAEVLSARIEGDDILLQFRSDKGEDFFGDSWETNKSDTQWRKPTDEELNNLARRMQVKNASEFYGYLSNLEKEYRKKNKMSTSSLTGGNVR